MRRPTLATIVCGTVALLLAGCGPSKVPEDKKDAATSDVLRLAPPEQRAELLDLINQIENAHSEVQLRDLFRQVNMIIIPPGVTDDCPSRCGEERDKCMNDCGGDVSCIKRCWGHYLLCLQDCVTAD
jgi:outer membrane murein-binding lipoprotein Lpp